MEGAVEYKIGADVDEGGFGRAAHCGKFPDGVAVDGVCFFCLLFAEINLGEGCAIQDESGFVIGESALQGGTIGDVELLMGWGDGAMAASDEEIGEGVTEHASAAGDED